MKEIQVAVDLITDEQMEELHGIMSDLVSVVNMCEELGGSFSEQYIAHLSSWTKKSEDFQKTLPRKPIRIIDKIRCDYSQEKVYRNLSLKRLEKAGIHP